jgi:hypothetical protein
MADTFNYDDDTAADLDTVSAVVADMSNAGKPSPPTDAEREEWQAWREQQEWLAEHQRRERERERAEAEAAKLAQERQTAALERAERTRKLQEEQRRLTERSNRDRTLTGILDAQIEQRQFRQQVLRAQTFANQRQRLRSALFPPEPPQQLPEPEIALDDEDAARWHRTWFK